jgi:hypothetical protein
MYNDFKGDRDDEHHWGVIDVRDPAIKKLLIGSDVQSETVLRPDVTHQIVKAGTLMYEKPWDGEVKYIPMKNGELTITFTKMEFDDMKSIMITATLGEQQVPLSPETFMGDDASKTLAILGVDLSSANEDEFTFAYMPDGSVVVNASYFDKNRMKQVDTNRGKDWPEFVALPNSYITGTGIKYMCNCSKHGLTSDFGNCMPWDVSNAKGSKGLSGGAIAGIAVGCAVVVGVIVAAVVIVLLKKKEEAGNEKK